ncbi:MAG: beta-propeller fold lactonase family protein [Deltaproteobacteria bacterium]|nr:beta-propeller fold lactonase family protein [Deltaproteobacteria bacterium]
MRLTRRVPPFALAALSWCAITAVTAPDVARAAALDFVSAAIEGESGVRGLAGVLQVVVSPDGRNVYAVGPASDAVAVFARDPDDGALRELEVQRDGIGNVDGIADASGIAVSPDGGFVYVAGAGDDAVASFARDAATGALTFLEAQKDGTAGVEGIRHARALAISPDGAFVYASGQTSDAIAVFSRNTLTGWLTFVEVQRQGALGVTGLMEPLGLSISPDGAHLYVASGDQSALTVFARDRATGHLTSRSPWPATDLGSVGVHSVAISPDGRFVYAPRQGDDTIGIFRRDRASGALELEDLIAQGLDGVEGLSGVLWAAVSPDGRRLYAASTLDHAVVAFERDPRSGALAFLERQHGAPGRPCLAFARSVVVSPDGRNVYVAGASSNAVVAYRVGEPDRAAP